MAASIRREQAESTRTALLDAAAAEFFLHGLDGTRIQDILDRAGVAKGGLYHHFTNKAEMAEALVQSAPWDGCLEALTELNLRGLAALEAFIRAVAAHADSDAPARALVRVAHELPDPAVDSGLEAWHEHLVRVLQQAIADGEVPDAISTRDAAGAITASLRGAILDPAPVRPLGERVTVLWGLLRPGIAAGAV